MDANAGYGESPGGKAEFFGGRSNRHVVTTRGGGSSEFLDWTYNSHMTYEVKGQAKLQEQTLARYRPLEGKSNITQASAPRVLAPRLTESADPEASDTRSQDERPGSSTDPWIAAIALLLSAGLGIAIGKGWHRPARHDRKDLP
jgi:hypothetical protein